MGMADDENDFQVEADGGEWMILWVLQGELIQGDVGWHRPEILGDHRREITWRWFKIWTPRGSFSATN